MVDAPKGCEEAAMMAKKVALVTATRKSGLSVVGGKEMWICESRPNVPMTTSKHTMLDFTPCND